MNIRYWIEFDGSRTMRSTYKIEELEDRAILDSLDQLSQNGDIVARNRGSGIRTDWGNEVFEGDIIRTTNGEEGKAIFENGAFYLECKNEKKLLADVDIEKIVRREKH